jgi:hypothetical protein
MLGRERWLSKPRQQQKEYLTDITRYNGVGKEVISYMGHKSPAKPAVTSKPIVTAKPGQAKPSQPIKK